MAHQPSQDTHACCSRGGPDADADAARIYAASFGKDAEFYDFYRAMQSYQVTFLGDGRTPPGSTKVILSPSNDYLKEFSGR